MICAACESAKARLHVGGSYNFSCLQCCVRLVLSAHPDKHQASVMLAAIGRFNKSPERDVILEAVRLAIVERNASLESTAQSLSGAASAIPPN